MPLAKELCALSQVPKITISPLDAGAAPQYQGVRTSQSIMPMCRDSLLRGVETCYPSDAEVYKALLPPPKKKG